MRRPASPKGSARPAGRPASPPSSIMAFRQLIEEAFAQSRRFFALPLADKETIAIETLGGNRGYSGLMHEALDPARGPDLKEAFNVGFDLKPDDPELLAGKPFRSLNPGRSLRDSARRSSPITTPAPRSERACTAPSPAASASSRAISPTSSTARWRPCGSCARLDPPPLDGRNRREAIIADRGGGRCSLGGFPPIATDRKGRVSSLYFAPSEP